MSGNPIKRSEYIARVDADSAELRCATEIRSLDGTASITLEYSTSAVLPRMTAQHLMLLWRRSGGPKHRARQ